MCPVKSNNNTENDERDNEEYCAVVINGYENQDANDEIFVDGMFGEESEIDTSNPTVETAPWKGNDSGS